MRWSDEVVFFRLRLRLSLRFRLCVFKGGCYKAQSVDSQSTVMVESGHSQSTVSYLVRIEAVIGVEVGIGVRIGVRARTGVGVGGDREDQGLKSHRGKLSEQATVSIRARRVEG